MNEPTPVAPPVTPPSPQEGETLEDDTGVQVTDSLFEKDETNAPITQVPLKIDTKQSIMGVVIVVILTLFFIFAAILLFSSDIDRAAVILV